MCSRYLQGSAQPNVMLWDGVPRTRHFPMNASGYTSTDKAITIGSTHAALRMSSPPLSGCHPWVAADSTKQSPVIPPGNPVEYQIEVNGNCSRRRRVG
jgi:hypothetical protein